MQSADQWTHAQPRPMRSLYLRNSICMLHSQDDYQVSAALYVPLLTTYDASRLQNADDNLSQQVCLFGLKRFS